MAHPIILLPKIFKGIFTPFSILEATGPTPNVPGWEHGKMWHDTVPNNLELVACRNWSRSCVFARGVHDHRKEKHVVLTPVSISLHKIQKTFALRMRALTPERIAAPVTPFKTFTTIAADGGGAAGVA